MGIFAEWLEKRISETFGDDAKFSVDFHNQLNAGGFKNLYSNQEHVQKDLLRMLGGDKAKFQQALQTGLIKPGSKPGWFIVNASYNQDPGNFKQSHIQRRKAEIEQKYPNARLPSRIQGVHNSASNVGTNPRPENPAVQHIQQMGFKGRDDAWDWTQKMRNAGHGRAPAAWNR